MALSFKDSLKKNVEANMVKAMNVAPTAMPMVASDVVADTEIDNGVMTLDETSGIAAYAGDDGNWQQHNGYTYYRIFSDDNLSIINDEKNIQLHAKQFNITQEENSQYIPFEMSRCYDGYDLVDATIFIHYETNSGTHGASKPINVTYNEEKIRFAWLVDANATADVGKLKFEIHAYGTVTGNDGKTLSYVWKSKTNGNLNVLESLCDCEDVINNIDDSWLQELITDITEKIAQEIAGVEVGAQVAAAEDAARRAESAASNAENTVNNALIGYATETYVDGKIDEIDVREQLEDYALKTYVDEAVESVDVSEQLENYALKTYVDEAIEGVDVSEQLENYALKTYVDEAVAAVDVSEELGDLGVNEDGTTKTVVQYVKEAIESQDITGKLGNYYTKEQTYNQTEIDDKLKNVSVDLSGYATTDSLNAIEETVTNVSKNTVANADNIATIQSNIATIQTTLNSLEGDNENLIVQYDETGSILHLYEKDENGDITITDGDGEIKVKEISSTIITGAGGGGGGSVSTIKISVNPDGENTSTILYGNDASLNYNLSTREATEGDDGETVYEEAIISGNITFTLYKDDVYVTQFTVKKTSSEVQSGNIDITEYVGLGSQVFSVRATYLEQLGDGETITVRSNLCKWTVNAVNLKLTNLPDSTWESTVKYGSATFSYTPVGALEKTVYFKIDNKEPETVVTSLNGTALTYTIPQQTHGVHTLQVWCEGNVGGTLISTEVYKYVLMFAENGNKTPIIRVKAPTTLEQYSSDYIYYNVFDPSNAIIDTVTLYDEDGVTLSTVEDITSAEQKWEFRPTVVKDKTITVQYKEITESVTIKVTKFPYEINAVTDSLMVDFVPTGRTNSDVDYNVFKNNAENSVTWTLSDNFDWVNGGWKIDENGDTYFCIKAGTSVDINYNLFGTDGVVAKKDANGEYTIAGTGKEFKLVFKTTNVAQANTTWLHCIDIADKNSLGIRMEAQNAYIDSSLGTLEIPYVDDDIIEFDMNIVPITKFLDNGEPNLAVKTIPMVITYEDGTPVQPKVITSASTNFKQDTPQPISIGSEYCDVHIYRMKVYERYLEDKEILTNFIADARSGTEMAKRYIRNDIYPIEDAQRITPESVATACPDLKVYVISAPYFTNDKGDKVANTTIRQLHNTGTKENPEWDINENWTATGATHNGQGTSSNEYGYSGRNLEFNMKKATITLGDNITVVKEIQLSPTSYPTNYLNFKINIASSENANNALLQKRYDRYLPYKTLASLMDDRKKNSMEFFNCVVFIQETNEDTSTHREFDNCDIQFYGIGNIGDSKKTDDTRVNDVDDPNEFCVEIMDWNRELSSFPANTMVNAMRYTTDPDTKEKVYTWAKDENLDILYELINGEYVLTKDTTVDLTKTYYVDALENDDFSEDYTYGFRYIQSEWDEDDDPNYKEKNEAFQKPLRQKWIEFYKFVTRDLTTNGKEDSSKVNAWKSEFSNWFILDAALYYYLYTLRYTMVDNRAKNSFWHWGKYYITFEEAMEKGISVYDEDKNLITDASNLPSRFYDVNGNEIKNINAALAAINNGYRMEFWMYDNDTAIGIDNAGKLEIPYGVEDNDTDSAGVPYFRANDSLVFTRIAKYFTTELENAWHNTEINPIGKVFDSTSFINEFDVWQEEFPEELWRLDYERKYKRTYVGGTGEEWNGAKPQSNKSDIVSTRFLTEMMNGRKKYQRRCFERNQEIYMSSKFKGEVNIGDTITLRGTGSPTNKVVEPNFALTITPFSKMYINLYNSTSEIYYHQKCEAGVTIVPPIEYPNTNLDFIYIRGASQIQSLGDLSPMYLQTAELTPGAKLKTITLGNATDGYSNDSLQTLQIGAGNKLLEELDIRNLSGLSNTVLPVTNIPSLKRVYAQGSNITEARFANNGLLEEAYLPETITRLELRNLSYLKTIELESYDNLLYLTVMNCSDMMNDLVLDMINQAPDLRELRVTNVDWSFDDTNVLERLYDLIETVDSPEVVLSGKVYVPTIRQKQLEDYQKVWSGLDISYDTYISQYPVTFVNDDNNNTVLEIQYVDEGGYAVDPVTREINPIPTPTKESIVSTDYAYVGWDNPLTGQIFMPTTVRAVYSESVRRYTVKYVSRGVVVQESQGDYGTNVPYEGDIPTYTLGESGWNYYLFNRWDKSGFVDGDKTINAIFDTFKYTAGAFDGKELKDLSPVQIYALTKLTEPIDKSLSDYGMEIESGDDYSFTMGYDIDYDDIDSEELISEKRVFSGGTNEYYDTGIKLFDEDKDFVLAIDYKMLSGNTTGATLMQCYQTSGTHGFKLSCEPAPTLSWGGTSVSTDGTAVSPSVIGNREMLVIQHKRGDKNLYIYTSNLISTGIKTYKIERDVMTQSDAATLIFGAAKTDAGRIANYAKGEINWCKIWYKDLGEDICRNLVGWIHEEITLEVSGFNRYQLHDDTTKESMMSLLATHLLSVKGRYNPNSYQNAGGWAECELNRFLNSRFYDAIPYQIKALMKKVSVKSTIGDNLTATSSSGCFVNIPALYDVYDSASNEYKAELYEFANTIDYFTGLTDSTEQTNRIRMYADGNEGAQYWLRSPSIGTWATSRYCYSIDKNGSPQQVTGTNAEHGILIEISF